jgi:hypothetical protein
MTESREMLFQLAVQLVLPVFKLSPVKSCESTTIPNSTQGKECVDRYLVRHEFIERSHEHYVKGSIAIPFPIRAVNHTLERSN